MTKLTDVQIIEAARLFNAAGLDLMSCSGAPPGTGCSGYFGVSAADAAEYLRDPDAVIARTFKITKAHLLRWRKRHAERYRCLGRNRKGKRCRLPAVYDMFYTNYDPRRHDYCRAHRTVSASNRLTGLRSA